MKTVILSTVTKSYQANILQSVLQNEGIESFIKNEILSCIIPAPPFEIEIYVFEKDYEKAKSIMNERFPLLGKE